MNRSKAPMGMEFEKNALVLFQGDSITNAFRSDEDPNDLGRGYALMVGGWLGSLFPEKQLRFLNRGVSGNTVKDLLARWEQDCLDLKPTWLSILIGINDTARHFRSDRPISPQEFEDTYREILSTTRDALQARLVLCEPFLLPFHDDYPAWRKELNPKIEVVRGLAREFGAVLVPLDGLFSQACTRQSPDYWSWDGVHLRPAGHAIVARAWLRAVGAL